VRCHTYPDHPEAADEELSRAHDQPFVLCLIGCLAYISRDEPSPSYNAIEPATSAFETSSRLFTFAHFLQLPDMKNSQALISLTLWLLLLGVCLSPWRVLCCSDIMLSNTTKIDAIVSGRHLDWYPMVRNDVSHCCSQTTAISRCTSKLSVLFCSTASPALQRTHLGIYS
jgi:hypothetical protein